jgi:protein-disulfide isomerase
MKNKKILISILIVVFLAIFSAIIYKNYQSKTSFAKINGNNQVILDASQDAVNQSIVENAKEEKVISANEREILKIKNSDIVLGDKNAPILIIEYASLSCPHCAAFHREALEKMKKEYIDNNQVAFIHRDFPLNQPALVAAMFAICSYEKNKIEGADKYYSILKALFRTQDSWAFDAKFMEKLESIANLDSMSSEQFNNCINNKNLQERILVDRIEAAKGLQIQSTPTFFINDQMIEGYVDYASIKKIIDEKLAKKTN